MKKLEKAKKSGNKNAEQILTKLKDNQQDFIPSNVKISVSTLTPINTPVFLYPVNVQEGILEEFDLHTISGPKPPVTFVREIPGS